MSKTLLDIKDHCNRLLFKFDVAESDLDIVLSNVWTKDYKVTTASIDGLRAIKYYADRRSKCVHVVAKTNKVFNLILNSGFHQNLLMRGAGDISNLVPESTIFMYSWRPHNGS